MIRVRTQVYSRSADDHDEERTSPITRLSSNLPQASTVKTQEASRRKRHTQRSDLTNPTRPALNAQSGFGDHHDPSAVICAFSIVD
ncbi:hypothetical protein RSOLAG1IB_08916 [Rhizoctonia solani AG-1 IB]|uniref:Uncharacterized protein n=1 Tax=Thanatephorus cucumeris (strain AG1-IB / isolate 7/3/14) TaxID=1108050 RepID=A0A0B7FLN7_THACB|nr:hypothetical protein RSOLAG1IB_08916 [Rhizoctonia solani AG-1 IB]